MNVFTDLTLVNIQNFISNLGFPVFMCLYFMYSKKVDETRHQKTMDKFNCLEEQLLETKLQIGQAVHNPPKEGNKP